MKKTRYKHLKPLSALIAGMAGFSAMTVLAQEAPPVSVPVVTTAEVEAAKPKQTSNTVEETVVLGTNIEGLQLSNPSPVITINSEALFENPSLNIMDFITSNVVQDTSASVQTQESFGGGNSINGSRNASPDLRGLGPENTLTLVNGQRSVEYAVPNSGGWRTVDLNATMPSIAFKRAEILTDGGGALYGTDAIGGVVNLVPDYGFDGVKVQLKRLGFPENVNLGSNHVGLMYGKQMESTSLVAALEWNQQDFITDADVGAWTNDIDLTRDPTDPDRSIVSATNYLAYERYLAAGETAPSSTTAWDLRDPLCERWQDLAPVEAGSDEFSAPIYGGKILNNSCQWYSNLAPGTTQPEKETMSYMVGLQHNFTERLNLEVNASYNTTEMVDARFWSSTSMFNPDRSLPNGQSVLIPIHNPGVIYNQSQASGWTLGSNESGFLARRLSGPSYMDYFEGNHESSQYRLSAVIGYELTENLNLKVGSSIGVSDVDVHFQNFIPENVQKALNGLGGYDCTGTTPGANGCEYFNPFMSALLPDAAARGLDNSFDIVRYVYGQDTRNWLGTLTSSSAILSGKIPAIEFAGGPLSFALGVETRKDRLEVDYDSDLEAGRYFNQSGVGLSDLDEAIRVDALMSELVLPVMDNFNVQLAVRAEEYDTGLSSVNPKIGLNWGMTDAITVRAAWGTSFKAPTLYHTKLSREAPAFISGTHGDQNLDVNTKAQQLGYGQVCNDPATTAQQTTGYLTAIDPVLGAMTPGGKCRPDVAQGSGSPSRINYAAIYSGREDLKAQESTNWSAGFDWDITDNLHLTASFVSVTFTNLIDIPPAGDTINLPECQPPGDPWQVDTLNGVPQGTGWLYRVFVENGLSCFRLDEDGLPDGYYQTPRNLASNKVEAIDLNVRYNLDTDFGQFSVSPSATVYTTWEAQLERGGVVADLVGKNPELGFGTPRAQYSVNLPVSWRFNNHRLTFTTRGTSGIDNLTGEDSYWTSNHSFSYTFDVNEELRFGVNWNNMFNDVVDTFGLQMEYTLGND